MFDTTPFLISVRNLLVALAAEVVTLSVCVAADTRTRDFQGLYGDEQTLEIALGYRKRLAEVPHVATVIEEADFRRIGARTLAEALVIAPGTQVVRGRGRIRLLNLRGLYNDLGPDVLFKRNNVPLTQGSFNTFNPLDLLPTNNIERIEIIRGPNSATDGADAFAGVVNIITKPFAGTAGSEAGARAGEDGTYDAWFNHGAKIGPLDLGIAFSGWTTEGDDRPLVNDFQSQLDAILRQPFSLAPGPLNRENHGADFELHLAGGPLRFRFNYYGVLDAALGNTNLQILDPNAHADTHVITADAIFSDKLGKNIEVNTLLAYLYKKEFLKERAPRTIPSSFAVPVLLESKSESQLFRAEGAMTWTGWTDHALRLSTGVYARELFTVDTRANARLVPAPDGTLIGIQTPEVRDFTDAEKIFPEDTQIVVFGSLLDEWRIARDWTLTSGVRVDDYSAGSLTATPRFSVVWEADHDTTLKWLYGRGLRVPTVAERLTRPIRGAAAGNPDLDPQTIDTVEFQVLNWGERYRLGVNAFGYWLHDRIATLSRDSTLTFENTGEETGYGVELESSYAPSQSVLLNANYGFRDTVEDPQSAIGGAARHLLFGEIRWEFLPETFFDINLNAVLDRERGVGDPRPPVEDYVVVNLALQRERLFGNVELAFTVRNLFDADARDPSSDTGLSALVPLEDIPLPSRTIWGGIRIRF